MSEQPQTNTAGNTNAEQQAVSSVTVENAAAVAALLLLEKQAVDAVSGPLRQLLRDIFRVLAGRYVLMFGGLDRPAADPVQVQQLTELLVAELQAVAAYDPSPQLQQFAEQAAARGMEYANRYLAVPVPPDAVGLDPVLTEAISAVPETMAESVASTANFVEQLPITGWDDLVRAMGKANQAATSLERSTTWAVNKANSDAIRQVAVNKGASLLWVAEPDACFIPSTRVLAPAVLTDGPALAAGSVTGDPHHGLSLDPPSGSVVLGGDPGARAATAVAVPLRDRFGEVQAVSSREYIGDVIRIRTASGKEVTGTPNHPVATSSGWVALGQLRVGDHVLGRSGSERMPLGVHPDDDDAPPAIEEVAQAFPMPVRVVPTSAEDFHGDGAGSDVHVVRTDGRLLVDRQSGFAKHSRKCVLQRRSAPLTRVDRACRRLLRGFAARLARIGGDSRADRFSAPFRRKLVRSTQVLSGRNARAFEPSAHRVHVDAVDHRDFVSRLAFFVKPDEIVDVWRGEFSGHVYNLQTVEGWYLAEGIVAHNCVICLALSGHIIDPMSGDGFDEEATFGRPGSAPDVWPPGEPLMGPPRHPGCRCHPELWFGAHVAPGGPEEDSLYNRPGVGANVDLPAALRREAKRSVVYGWSLPSESGTVRLDAASRLLARGAGLPRSVEERGHRAVAKGAFDNRIHPSHRRRAARR